MDKHSHSQVIGSNIHQIDVYPWHEIGTRVPASDGHNYIYVQAAEAISADTTIIIAGDLTATAGAGEFQSPVGDAVATNEYFWAKQNSLAGGVPALSAPVQTVAHTISGGPTSGSDLTKTVGTWTGNPTPVVSTTWRRDLTEIGGETGLTYTTTIPDEGSEIKARETATNSQGTVISDSNGITITSPGLSIDPQSFDFGELTIASAGSVTVIASGATTFSITAGDPSAHWSIDNSGVLSLTAAGDTADLSGSPYSLTVEVNDGGTPTSATVTVTAEADTAHIRSAAERDAIFAALDASVSVATAVKVREGATITPWTNSALNNRVFGAMVTYTSENPLNPCTITTSDVGFAAELRVPGNLTISEFIIEANFDRTFHFPFSPALVVKGIVDNFIVENNEFRGNLLEIGPGAHFTGALGLDGTTDIAGDYTIRNNVIHGYAIGLYVGDGNDTVEGLGTLLVEGNEIYDFLSDGIKCLPQQAITTIKENTLHSPYSDPWRVQMIGGAYFSHTGALTGAADGKKFLAMIRVEFTTTPSPIETIYSQGTAGGSVKIWRDAAGLINCTIADTSAGAPVNLQSTVVVGSYVKTDILISIDTDGDGYLYIKKQLADGTGAWVQEDTETYASETLDLASGDVGLAGLVGATEKVSGYFERIMIWYGQAPDITSSTIRDKFAGAFNARVLPSVAIADYGTPIVGFYGDFQDWNAVANNQGSGGNFTRVGSTDNDHGDFIQLITGVSRDIDGVTIDGNDMFGGRDDGSPFELNNYQGIFLEDIADVTNQYMYVDTVISNNRIFTHNTLWGIGVANPLRLRCFGNLIGYNSDWIEPGALVPRIQLQLSWGGNGAEDDNHVVDNVTPFVQTMVGTNSVTDNNIASDHDDVGANSWANLFDGDGSGGFKPTTPAEAVSWFAAKSGGPLLTAIPNIGPEYTGEHPRYADIGTFPTYTDVVDAVLSTESNASAQFTSVGANGALVSIDAGQFAIGTTSGGVDIVAKGTANAILADNQWLTRYLTSSGSNNTAVNQIAEVGVDVDTWTVTTVALSAFPAIEQSALTSEADFTTSVEVDMPASAVTSGNLLVCALRLGDPRGITVVPSGWTLVGEDAAANSTNILVYKKTSDGTEGGTTITFTVNTAVNAAAITYEISDADNTDVEVAFATASLDPPSLSPAGGSAKYLWLAVTSSERCDNNITVAPTDYANLLLAESDPGSSSGGNCTIGCADRENEVASENPGTFTWTGSTNDPKAATISVGPA